MYMGEASPWCVHDGSMSLLEQSRLTRKVTSCFIFLNVAWHDFCHNKTFVLWTQSVLPPFLTHIYFWTYAAQLHPHCHSPWKLDSWMLWKKFSIDAVSCHPSAVCAPQICPQVTPKLVPFHMSIAGVHIPSHKVKEWRSTAQPHAQRAMPLLPHHSWLP